MVMTVHEKAASYDLMEACEHPDHSLTLGVCLACELRCLRSKLEANLMLAQLRSDGWLIRRHCDQRIDGQLSVYMCLTKRWNREVSADGPSDEACIREIYINIRKTEIAERRKREAGPEG